MARTRRNVGPSPNRHADGDDDDEDDSAVLGVAALTHRLTEPEVGDTGGTEDHGYNRRGPRERAELSDGKRKRTERRHTRALFSSLSMIFFSFFYI